MANQEQTQKTDEYFSQSFDANSIQGDLMRMCCDLRNMKSFKAALACDNAKLMIIRLQTIIHETYLPLGFARQALVNGDLDKVAECLDGIERTLKISTRMEPDTSGPAWWYLNNPIPCNGKKEALNEQNA